MHQALKRLPNPSGEKGLPYSVTRKFKCPCGPLAIIEAWRTDYNTLRPHTSLDGLTPTEFAARPSQGHIV